jgi:hypothetical protein
MSLLSDILGTGAGVAAVAKAYEDLGSVGREARSGADVIAQQGLEQTQFQPYTLTSSIGGAQAGAGGLNLNLSPQQQALMDQLGVGASNLFSQAMQGGMDPNLQAIQSQSMSGINPQAYTQVAQNKQNAFGLSNQMIEQAGTGTGQRESDVYGRIRAMQTPGEERDRLALEERLANQGRLGVRTSMFGGTPEQFAQSQAQGEAQNQAAMMAMQQAQSEQAQQAGIGATFGQFGQAGTQLQQQLSSQNIADFLAAQQGGLQQSQFAGNLGAQMLQGQYLPQAALLQQLTPTLQNAEMAQRNQLAGAGMFGEASMGGLEALLGSGLGQANLMGNVGSGLLAGIFSNPNAFSFG